MTCVSVTNCDVHLIALSMLYRSSQWRLKQLLQTCPDTEQAWEQADCAGKEQVWAKAEEEAAFVKEHQIAVYDYRTDDYPRRLQQCLDAPVLLYGKGNLIVNGGKFVSVVGTRRATAQGQENTRRLVLDLAQMVPDVTIVSGLAYGIDVAAHRAALEAGLPTIIVPAHGLDRVYPQMHREVAVAALKDGGILTEYPTGTEPEKMNFVARNRIVAGLGDALVVMESPEKGGSLITAGLANDYNRDVFAAPGRMTDTNYQGCNALIRDHKAGLIQNAEDLVFAMGWNDTTTVKTPAIQMQMDFDELPQHGAQILNLLRQSGEPLHVNSILMELGLDYGETISTLMELELKDLVKGLPGGMFLMMN